MANKQPIFVDGVSWKRPSEITKQKAPWVKGHMSFNVKRLRAWLDKHENGDWLNIDLKESRDKSKLYFELNTYKPEPKKRNPYDLDEDVPLLGVDAEDLSLEKSFEQF